MAGGSPPWTKGEERKLRELRARGINNIEASQILKRTLSAVVAKVRNLGLPPLKPLTPGEHMKRQKPPAEPVVRAGKSTLPPLPSLEDKRC